MPDRPRVKFKVVLIGESGVGKTSLIRRYVRNAFGEDYIRTLGTTISKRVDDLVLGPRKGLGVDLLIWDIIGNRRIIDLLGEAYFDNTQGALAVFDITQGNTLEALKEWIGAARTVVPGMPVLILGNKSDLVDLRQITDGRALDVAHSLGLHYMSTSAKTGENVETAFRRLALEILRTFPMLHPVARRE